MGKFNSYFQDFLDNNLKSDELEQILRKSFTGTSGGHLSYPPTHDYSSVIEMPGVKREAVSVTRQGEQVNVTWTSRHGEARTNLHYVSSKYFDLDKISCSLENGLFSLTVPLKTEKPEQPSKPPVIKIDIK